MKYLLILIAFILFSKFSVSQITPDSTLRDQMHSAGYCLKQSADYFYIGSGAMLAGSGLIVYSLRAGDNNSNLTGGIITGSVISAAGLVLLIESHNQIRRAGKIMMMEIPVNKRASLGFGGAGLALNIYLDR